jgi:hypothetical protein
MQNIDLSLDEELETGRERVQLRWEVYNVFNHRNFQLPDVNFNDTNGGYISATQQAGNGGASGTGAPRIMQFALRYEF